MRVQTVRNTYTGRESVLCAAHLDTIGGSAQVQHGDHEGSCEECDRLAAVATRPTGPTITAVRIYQHDGEWCYAADTMDGYDHSDTIDVEHDATPDEAEREVRTALKIDAAVSVECLTGPKAQ